jgi:hypothetical protein
MIRLSDATLVCIFSVTPLVAAGETPRDLIQAALTRPWPGESFPVLPTLSTEMRGRVANEIASSREIRAAYSLLDAKNRRNVEWFQAVTRLENAKAVWCLQSCLCHPSEDVQIRALQSLRRVGDKKAVHFLLLYAEYMAVCEDGSENATIHGIIHESIASASSDLTGVRLAVDGQDPEGLRLGIKKWRKWLVDQDSQENYDLTSASDFVRKHFDGWKTEVRNDYLLKNHEIKEEHVLEGETGAVAYVWFATTLENVQTHETSPFEAVYFLYRWHTDQWEGIFNTDGTNTPETEARMISYREVWLPQYLGRVEQGYTSAGGAKRSPPVQESVE